MARMKERDWKGTFAEKGGFKRAMLQHLAAGDAVSPELAEALILQMFGGVSRHIGSARSVRGSINIGIINPSVPLRSFLLSLVEKLEMFSYNDLRQGLWQTIEGWEFSPGLEVRIDGITMLDGISDEATVDMAIRAAHGLLSLKEDAETPLLMLIDTHTLDHGECHGDDCFLGLPRMLLECLDYIHIGRSEEIRRQVDNLFRVYSSSSSGSGRRTRRCRTEGKLEEYVAHARSRITPQISDRLLRKARRAVLHMCNEESEDHRRLCTPMHFGSVVRLAEAHSRMRHSNDVEDSDVERAISLIKGSLARFDEALKSGHEFRLRLGNGAGSLQPAKRADPRFRLDDVVLPEEVKSDILIAIADVRSREAIYERWGASESLRRHSGTSILLVGPPGTGKTMTAEAIAGHLGRGLLSVNLASLTSSYIGETMRNIQEVFDEAAENGDVLLFDEADALFCHRVAVFDSTDALINRDTSFLLSLIETQKGITILTSNLPMNIDPALERRIDTVVRFTRPTAEEQAEIFRRLMPASAPIEKMEYERIAARYPLCGGNIVNVVKRLLRKAALRESLNLDPTIRMREVEQAVRREFSKSGEMGSIPDEVVPGYS